MRLVVKYFEELTTIELYEILKSRMEIFVVEQKSTHQDLDDKDYQSLHIFFEDNRRVVGYVRAFFKEDNVVQMGRVLTLYHGKGIGRKLLKEGIEHIKNKMNPKEIYIDAQSYAVGFYELVGFEVCSDEFIRDGIPHIAMNLKL
ncbi:GNAT family N-acetyltransferase [Candidatus Arthromitus sp. SFB-rat-Yit]|uniref:GNAT family N-acetyltransferase n=1 Tax=Candidatus Arthromitus sp. SFB-rat-Yit TaxID=1041504 RepID=UPI000227A768|nr:GNAT family N-acetyltransferase [Candidatus Arthromitus sp. SFB-rat-Yit]BAK81152.1 putative acyltransferase [Candidatus Arthromitus sp. SFB-rat-Yit]